MKERKENSDRYLVFVSFYCEVCGSEIEFKTRVTRDTNVTNEEAIEAILNLAYREHMNTQHYN
jgi:hypothetical protein